MIHLPHEPEAYVGQAKKTFGVTSREDEIKAAIESGHIMKDIVTIVENDRAYVQIGDIRGVIPISEFDAKHKLPQV